jgi:hypothetical protein
MSQNIPLLRRFNATISALNTLVNAVDQETGQVFLFVNKPNMILDVVNDPDPASGNYYTIQLWKGGKDTGIRFYSTGLSPNSAGRVNVGPIPLIGGGNYHFKVVQTAGTAANYNFVVKFANPPEQQ